MVTSTEVNDNAVRLLDKVYNENLAPWMRGFYERMVGLVKRALHKTIESQCLTEKQLVTVLTEVKAVVNSRLLVYVDKDINSNLVHTPSDFLSLHSHHVIPDITGEDDPEFDIGKKLTTSQQLLETWKLGQKWLNQLWCCWKNDYLLSLRERETKKSNHGVSHLKVGQVVLIKDSLPRGQWRVEKILELIKGRDERIRSAKVTVTPRKELHRALNMLYPLECIDPSDSKVDKPTASYI